MNLEIYWVGLSRQCITVLAALLIIVASYKEWNQRRERALRGQASQPHPSCFDHDPVWDTACSYHHSNQGALASAGSSLIMHAFYMPHIIDHDSHLNFIEINFRNQLQKLVYWSVVSIYGLCPQTPARCITSIKVYSSSGKILLIS